MTEVHNIAPVMITVDRGDKYNYLGDTLHNLIMRQGVYLSPNLEIFDSKPGGFAQGVVDEKGIGDYVNVDTPSEVRCANINVAAALRAGSFRSDWVLFLEDDVDFCGDFMDSTLAWLSDHVSDEYRVYPLGANYAHILALLHGGKTSWKYHIPDFYGTQAFALRSEDALDLAIYLEEDPYRANEDGTAWDLIMHSWMKHRYPELQYFLTPAPSFVQHTGRNSVVEPRDDIHIFPSFPGPYWTYMSSKAAANG